MVVAYREVFVVEVREILRQWMMGHGLRRIAGATGLDRKTVRRYVHSAEATGLTRGGGSEALTDERIGAVLERLRVGSPGEHGTTWEVCEAHRAAP